MTAALRKLKRRPASKRPDNAERPTTTLYELPREEEKTSQLWLQTTQGIELMITLPVSLAGFVSIMGKKYEFLKVFKQIRFFKIRI